MNLRDVIDQRFADLADGITLTLGDGISIFPAGSLPLPVQDDADEESDSKQLHRVAPGVYAEGILMPVTDEMLRDMGMLYGPFLDELGWKPPSRLRARLRMLTGTLTAWRWRVTGARDVLLGRAQAQYEDEEDDYRW